MRETQCGIGLFGMLQFRVAHKPVMAPRPADVCGPAHMQSRPLSPTTTWSSPEANLCLSSTRASWMTSRSRQVRYGARAVWTSLSTCQEQPWPVLSCGGAGYHLPPPPSPSLLHLHKRTQAYAHAHTQAIHTEITHSHTDTHQHAHNVTLHTHECTHPMIPVTWRSPRGRLERQQQGVHRERPVPPQPPPEHHRERRPRPAPRRPPRREYGGWRRRSLPARVYSPWSISGDVET
jgi:hypothetical protein